MCTAVVVDKSTLVHKRILVIEVLGLKESHGVMDINVFRYSQKLQQWMSFWRRGSSNVPTQNESTKGRGKTSPTLFYAYAVLL